MKYNKQYKYIFWKIIMTSRITPLFLIIFTASQLLGSNEPTSCPDQKKHVFNPFKTAWEHKKKIITITGAGMAVLFLTVYRTQTEWNRLFANFLQHRLEEKDFYWPETKKAAEALAYVTHNSWFVLPEQKTSVAYLIALHSNLFKDWKSIPAESGRNRSFQKK